jgi:predicted nucleotidyltransferase
MNADSASTSHGLPAHVVAAIATVLASFPQVEQAILHGSRARGDFRPGSDIDLCLDGNGLTLSLLFKIEHALDNLLLPYTRSTTPNCWPRLSDWAPASTAAPRNET